MSDDTYTTAARRLQGLATMQSDIALTVARDAEDPQMSALLVRLAASWVDIGHVFGLIIARHTGETVEVPEC